MPDVVYPYIPTNGDTLVPSDLNKDLYTTPDLLPANKLSIYETSNGRIEPSANFVAGFQVKAHHVRPWQVGDAQAAGLVPSVDYYEDAWGGGVQYFGIAGAQMTFYQKYDTSMAIMVASLFMSTWRQRGPLVQDAYTSVPIKLRMYMDGQVIAHTEREAPETVYFPTTANYAFDFSRESQLTRHLNLFHPRCTGGSEAKKHDPLLKGWHTFGFGIFIRANQASEQVKLQGSAADPTVDYPLYTFDALHRVRVYARNASVLRLL